MLLILSDGTTSTRFTSSILTELDAFHVWRQGTFIKSEHLHSETLEESGIGKYSFYLTKSESPFGHQKAVLPDTQKTTQVVRSALSITYPPNTLSLPIAAVLTPSPQLANRFDL